jgi:hypothetical protein
MELDEKVMISWGAITLLFGLSMLVSKLAHTVSAVRYRSPAYRITDTKSNGTGNGCSSTAGFESSRFFWFHVWFIEI